MAKSSKYDNFYMDLASRIAKQSHAKRMKVGSLIVRDRRILSMGWNGMPHGFPNECETKDNVTKSEVLHSEMNCLMKMAESTESSKDAVMYSTHSPCLDCAKAIYQAKIRRFVYLTEYRKTDGLTFLVKCGVQTNKLKS